MEKFQVGSLKKTHFENIMRGLGMCVWSWPFGDQEMEAYNYVSLCCGDMGIKFPYPHLPPEEQPALFYDFLGIYSKARSDYMERGK